MPIVNVQMFPGRTTIMKELLGRAIVDAVAEIAGPPRENVQVLFSDVPTNEWAIGPTLVSSRRPTPAPRYAAAVVSVGQVDLKPGQDDGYLAWWREEVLPFLSTEPGFLSSTLARQGTGRYLVVEKWTSVEARQQSRSTGRWGELEAEALRFVEQRPEELTGHVVDVLRNRS